MKKEGDWMGIYKMWNRRAIFFLLFSGIIVLSACANPEPLSTEGELNPKLETSVPFQLEGLNESEILNNTQLERPLLMMYWATWCHFCKEDMPMVESLYEEYGDRVQFAAVNLTHLDSIPSIERYVEQSGVRIPIYLDREGEVTGLFHIRSTPTTILLDQHGNEVNRRIGAIGKNNRDTLKNMLEELLEK